MQGDDLDVDPCPGEFDRLGGWLPRADAAGRSAQPLCAATEEVYLDHAGATLHARSQLEECMAILTGSVLGNSRMCRRFASFAQPSADSFHARMRR